MLSVSGRKGGNSNTCTSTKNFLRGAVDCPDLHIFTELKSHVVHRSFSMVGSYCGFNASSQRHANNTRVNPKAKIKVSTTFRMSERTTQYGTVTSTMPRSKQRRCRLYKPIHEIRRKVHKNNIDCIQIHSIQFF